MSTEDDFSLQLIEDITWRLRELTELVRACTDGNELKRNAHSRALLPILYAHWEGYFVTSANKYLNFLTLKRLYISGMRDEFWTLSVRKKFKPNQVSGDINFSKFLMALKSVPDQTFKRGNFEKINGQSNLNSEVLKFSCNCLGIDHSPFAPYFSFIDEKLIAKRNYIAHGEALRFDPNDVGEYRENVISLMRLSQTQFENAAHFKSYLRK